VLATGSLHKLPPIRAWPRTCTAPRHPEALYMRDHLTRQIELADASDDLGEPAARLTVVVGGAGYTGTEVVAQGLRYAEIAHRRHPRLGA
jgi:NADH:quinone reductase (non-electrogenic)